MEDLVNNSRARAEALLNKLNEAYGDEVFVSDGYAYFDDLAQAIAVEFSKYEERIIELEEEKEELQIRCSIAYYRAPPSIVIDEIYSDGKDYEYNVGSSGSSEKK